MDDNNVISNFCSFTGQTEEIALQFLSMADFDIERAVDLFFTNGDAILAAQEEERHENHHNEFNSPKPDEQPLHRVASSYSRPPEDAQIVRVYSDSRRS